MGEVRGRHPQQMNICCPPDLPGGQRMRGDKLIGELPRRSVGHHYDVRDSPDPSAVRSAQPRVQATWCRLAHVDALGSCRASSEEASEIDPDCPGRIATLEWQAAALVRTHVRRVRGRTNAESCRPSVPDGSSVTHLRRRPRRRDETCGLLVDVAQLVARLLHLEQSAFAARYTPMTGAGYCAGAWSVDLHIGVVGGGLGRRAGLEGRLGPARGVVPGALVEAHRSRAAR